MRPVDDVLRGQDEQNEWRELVEVDDGDKDGRSRIGLQRFPGTARESKGPVLLVHGASAANRTFLVPEPAGAPAGTGGLTGYLRARGWDVWLLDWRSSGVLAPRLIDVDKRPARTFTLDHSERDLAAAVRYIVSAQGTPPKTTIPVVGHCIGGALVAQAIAKQAPQGSDPGSDPILGHLGSVVLTTLALFFRAGIDDWMKGNERFLEDAWWETTDQTAFISPWVADPGYRGSHGWPQQLERAYELWQKTMLPHDCKDDFCRRACFMFGMPYRPHDMMDIHDQPYPQGLWRQFGRMPLAMYMHCVQNMRRGWVGPWQAHDDNDDYLRSQPFGGRRVTLITGNENQVWHRESIDRMYEWLCNELPVAARSNITKHVFSRYGHQDLYWSRNAARDVYPVIEAGLAS